MNISFDVPYFSFMLLILNVCKEIDLALGCFQLIITVFIQQHSHIERTFYSDFPIYLMTFSVGWQPIMKK